MNNGEIKPTHVKPGDVVILNHSAQTLRIIRPDGKNGFLPLDFQDYRDGRLKENKFVYEANVAGMSILDFFEFMLSVTNLVYDNYKFDSSNNSEFFDSDSSANYCLLKEDS